jgi:fatty acid amide hydrolase
VVGPLGKSVNDLKLAMESLVNENLYKRDSSLAPVPFDTIKFDQTLRKKLRIGYFEDTPLLNTSEAVKRSLRLTKQKLEALGHEVIPFPLSLQETQEYQDLHVAGCTIGVVAQFHKCITSNYDDFIPIYRKSMFYFSSPRWVQALMRAIVGSCLSQRQVKVMRNIKNHNKFEIDDILRRIQRFQDSFKQRWNEMRLDAMVSPVFQHAAFRKEEAEELGFFVPFLSLWNVLNYPAGVVPVTQVEAGEDSADGGYGDSYGDLFTRKIRDSMPGSRGMPLGVQVAAPQWQDEQCLAVMNIISESVKYKGEPKIIA